MDLQKAQTMATDMMKHYNLVGWAFRFDRSVSRLGMCSHGRKTIFLSTHATTVNSEEQVLNTILHEIAHALVSGDHGHDDVWRNKAISIGCDGERCSNIAVKAPSKYTIACKSCNQIRGRLYRLTQRYATRLEFMWCSQCGKEQSKGKLVLTAA
jgi:predicted SprT family Zn-dependent metalloprotease